MLGFLSFARGGLWNWKGGVASHVLSFGSYSSWLIWWWCCELYLFHLVFRLHMLLSQDSVSFGRRRVRKLLCCSLANYNMISAPLWLQMWVAALLKTGFVFFFCKGITSPRGKQHVNGSINNCYHFFPVLFPFQSLHHLAIIGLKAANKDILNLLFNYEEGKSSHMTCESLLISLSITVIVPKCVFENRKNGEQKLSPNKHTEPPTHKGWNHYPTHPFANKCSRELDA